MRHFKITFTAMRYLVIIVILLQIACRASQEAQPPSALDARLVELSTLYRERYGIPALGIAVIRSHGQPAMALTGSGRVNSNTPLDQDAPFHLGSNTKAMTAFIAARLVEAGRIDWNSTIAEVNPAWRPLIRADYQQITLADLLSHRAGLQPFIEPTEFTQLPTLPGSDSDQRRAFSLLVMQKPSRNRNISRLLSGDHEYSNSSYVVAAALLETADGRNYDQLLARNMRELLHLEYGVGFPADQNPNWPSGHVGSGDAIRSVPSIVLPRYFTPAGNVQMNLANFAAWIQIHLRGLRGQDRHLNQSTYEFMHYGRPDYAMGWKHAEHQGMRISYHDGSAGTFFTRAIVMPDSDLALVFLTNISNDAVRTAVSALEAE
ncbi:MAG: beta-lactamase family protein, partial [Leptospiraceae bacterium]|nr:beta-lactamase family protein [Leptospiraceae bacterium]